MLKKIIPFLLVISLVISSCLSYEEVTLTKVVDTKVKSFTAEKVEMEISLQINNPNNYKITITNTDLDIMLNGTALGKAIVDQRIVIPKKSNNVHTFTVKLKNKDLASKAMPAMLGAALGGSMRMTVKGTIKAKAKMISKKVPIEFTENLSR